MEVKTVVICKSPVRLGAFREYQTAYILDNGVEMYEYILPPEKVAAFVAAGGCVVEEASK